MAGITVDENENESKRRTCGEKGRGGLWFGLARFECNVVKKSR
jgi:hypothetical protein